MGCIFYLSTFSGLSTIFQLTFMLSEGRQSTLYYLCIGQMPAHLVNEQVKFNLPFYVLKILSIACHMFVAIRFIVDRITGNKQSKIMIYSTSEAHLNKINKESLFRSVVILLLCWKVQITLKVNLILNIVS
jgi:hypothetical protein